MPSGMAFFMLIRVCDTAAILPSLRGFHLPPQRFPGGTAGEKTCLIDKNAIVS